MDFVREKYTKMENIFKHTNMKNPTKNSSSLMQSMEFPMLEEEDLMEDLRPRFMKNETPVMLEAPFQSLPLHPQGESFQLISPEEEVKVSSVDALIHLLDCPDDCKLRVVSIFGHAGDGKSHSLNHLLFRGKEVFKTSGNSEHGTQGVWAAWQPSKKLLCLDTPPLNNPETSRTLLFKVLALSDVVIYRTRAEKLPGDMFKFLGEASRACEFHFQIALQKVGLRVDTLNFRGPAVIVNHEPRHTPPLRAAGGLSPEEQIINQVRSLDLDVDKLGDIYYAPSLPSTSSTASSPTLAALLCNHLDNSSVKVPRRISVFFESLNSLSERFKGGLVCQAECKCCQAKCFLSMGHTYDGIKHSAEVRCKYQQQYENKIYVCQICKTKVKEVNANGPQESILGFARSAWNGYELHCPRCGPVYRSRQYWYGNKSPEEFAVNAEIVHVWPGSASTVNPGGVGVRRALEGVGSLTGALASCWLADAIAPAYWQPTSQINNCYLCRCKLEAGRGEIHHCRWCGMGVCGPCSPVRKAVPHRGWLQPVRVCNGCVNNEVHCDDGGDITARMMGEAMAEVLSPLTAALQIPKDILKDFARPSYWVPDEQAPACIICSVMFGTGPDCTVRHHCRKCGQSVCATCSPHRQTVPERGWTSPVRVCSTCVAEKNE